MRALIGKLRALVLSLTVLAGGAAHAQDAAPGSDNAPPPAVPTATENLSPGFDYWMLLLSWSPEYCRIRPSDPECRAVSGYREPLGFVVHGVHPQFEIGQPRRCIDDPEPLPDEILDRAVMMMPNPQLVRSEWRRHGTCSGLSPSEYFIFVERAFRRIEIPAEYRAPDDYVDTDLDTVKQKFLAANPDLTDDSIALRCSNRWLKEIRVCFSNDMQPRACGRDIDDRCRAGKISLRPIRGLPPKKK